jgi:hypothetical protein
VDRATIHRRHRRGRRLEREVDESGGQRAIKDLEYAADEVLDLEYAADEVLGIGARVFDEI